jgi:ABC-type multidrug transport system fused ATPase/permease subunit
MMDFLEWCFHYKTPSWVGITMIMVLLLLAMIAALVTIFLISWGYWIVLPLWLIVPLSLVVSKYLKEKKDT